VYAHGLHWLAALEPPLTQVTPSTLVFRCTTAKDARKVIKSAKIQLLVSVAAHTYQQDAVLTAAAAALMSKIGGRL